MIETRSRCIRCTAPAENPAWACCLNCRLALAEIDRNARRALGDGYRDRVARRLLEEAFAC